RLRHGRHEILRSTNVLSDKQNVQVRAIADLASPKFSERDDGQLPSRKEFRDKNQARFSDMGKLGKDSCWLEEPKYVAKNNAQKLPLTIGANRIEIVCGCA